MNSLKIASFVQGLARETLAGNVKWYETEGSAFATDVKSVQVAIDFNETGAFDELDYILTFTKMPDNIHIITVTDVDLKGALSNAYGVMQGLYNNARLQALGLDTLLDEVLDEFDDDIPF
ncbi:hypothetical protein MyNCGM683_11960 [Achromobacter xylosoxidans]